MGKEDEWIEMMNQRSQQQAASLGKSVEERDRVPDKACGKCVHFLETPYEASGNGNCDLLRFGSDIIKDPPVYVLEGEIPLMTHITMDAVRCKHYELREFIDTDATETSDPRYRRKMRQMKQELDK